MSVTEVPIRTLKNGQCFALHLDSGSVITGRLLERNAGSARTTMGHWSLEALVEPITETEYQNKTEDTKMAKKERKAKAEPKVTTFAHTAKESKLLSDKENKSQLAVIYRSVGENGPCEFESVWKDVRDTMHKAPNGSKLDKRETNVRTYLSRLVKSGLVKRVVAKGEEEAKLKAEKPAKGKVAAKKAPKAAAKPRKAPKAKPAKAPVVQTQPELSEPVQAAVEHIEQGMEKLGQEEQATA